MEKLPDIVMQCPECKKEFPVYENYCEDCTAMLEPVEIQQKSQDASAARAKEPPEIDNAAYDDTIEDSTIDALKTDIEESFVFTLLFELHRLKERITKKEGTLAALHTGLTDTTDPEFIQKVGKAESEVSALLKRTAKIESILDYLLKKLEGDVAKLDKQIEETDQSGLLTHLTPSGRHHRMLASQRSVKKGLLKAIAAKSFKRRRSVQKFAIIAAALVLIIAAAIVFSLSPLSLNSSKTMHTRSPETPQQTETKTAIQAKDLYQLLEDIRIANIRKDLWLWQSRYTARYLEERGRKDDIVGQWKKVDYLSLQYRVEDIRMLPSMTTAIVAWDMELKSLDTGKTNTSSQKLYSEFIFEDGRLKIASVRKAEK
jgi:hypothetical protein